MKRLRIICSVLCLALGVLLTSCSGRTDVSSGESYIFCLNTDRTGLVKISYDIPEGNAQEAAEAAQGKAEDAQEAIENLSVSAETLPPDQEATVEKTVSPDGVVSLAFGIPQGKTGNVMYATFAIDPETGLLTMTTPDGYTGPTFAIVNGFLEVSINNA